jgi:phosphatidylserine decarboxylase
VAQRIYFVVVKHSGKASAAALKLVGLSGLATLVLLSIAFLARTVSSPTVASVLLVLAGALIGLWLLFALFTVYFFRDPEPVVPAGRNLVLAPGHGKVDTIDFTTEAEFMGGECRRVSIFLSVFDVHVQNAPLTGRIAFFKHSPGQYLNAMRTDCGQFNENVLIGFEAAEPAGLRLGVRLIAGLIARRIVPFVAQNERVERGQRISLIQFGSRADIYLPKDARIKVQLGDRVVGGQTILAELA